MVKDNHGNLVSEEPKILERWAYFQEHLNQATEKEALPNEVHESHDVPDRDQHFESEPILHKIKTSIKCMKNIKASRKDRITAELLKYGGETLALEVHKLLEQVSGKEQMPNTSNMPYTYEGKFDCTKFRGVSLLNVCDDPNSSLPLRTLCRKSS